MTDPAPTLGSRWRVFTRGPDGLDDAYVRVLALETNHALVEIEGEEDRWGGPRRQWLPLTIWTTRWSSVYRVDPDGATP